MQISPEVIATQLAKLDPGDLFIVHDDTGSYVALAVKDPHKGDQLVVVLGPASPKVPQVPTLTGFPSHTPVVSFSKKYTLRLPYDPKAWLLIEPQSGPCIVLSGNKLYIRARYGWGGQNAQTYVGIDGLLVTDPSGQFRHPRGDGDCAYAVEWSFLSTESKPRMILSFPQSDLSNGRGVG